MDLPEKWQFLGVYWWLLHVVAVGLVFWIGFLIGRVSGETEDKEQDSDRTW